MATLLPFRAVRPTKELAKEIAAPPYDVVTSSEARTFASGNDKSYLRISRPEIDLAAGIDEHDESVYAKGKENYLLFRKEGWLKQDPTDCFYVYKQIMGNHSQIGLVAVASCDDYDNDIIKKHEYTRPDKEDDRTKHVDTIGANTEPVFFTYRHVPKIDQLISQCMKERPEYDFTSEDGVHHTFWVCSNKKLVDEIANEFSKIKFLYVADGHHRSAAASRVRQLCKKRNASHTGKEDYNFFLTVVFPDNQMNIMAYNRVVKDLNGLSSEQFLAKISDKFEVTASGKNAPDSHLCFSMYLDGKWYSLKARKASFDAADPVKRLDASILQDNLLSPLLGIQNPRTDKRINFVGGIKGPNALKKMVDSGGYKVAFSLYPVSVDQVMDTADAGKVMPPKSTWFEPKLKSGLFVHEL